MTNERATMYSGQEEAQRALDAVTAVRRPLQLRLEEAWGQVHALGGLYTQARWIVEILERALEIAKERREAAGHAAVEAGVYEFALNSGPPEVKQIGEQLYEVKQAIGNLLTELGLKQGEGR